MSVTDDLRQLVAGQDAHGPGGVLVVAREGVVQASVAFGSANLEHGIANSLDTVFYIASTSKQFVAAAVAVLELDGQLDPEEPVARWVPEVAQLGDLRIHHLVHHTSGVRDKYALAVLGRLPDEATATDAGTARLLSRQRELSFEPGSRFLYSNSNYWLLAQIVERCTGERLTAFTDRRLFAPLDMHGTRFRADPSEVVPRRASGYAPAAGGGWGTAEYTRPSLGPGGVISTASSLARWGALHRLPEHAPLAERLRRTRPTTDGSAGSYAYGVVVGEHAGRTLLHHAGGVEGFGAEMLQVPDEGLTVVCLTNRPAPLAAVLARSALAAVLPAGGTSGSTAAAGRDEASQQQLVGSFLDADESTLLTIEPQDDGLVLGLQGRTWTRGPGEQAWTGPAAIEVAVAGDALSLRANGQELTFTRLADLPSPSREQLCGLYRSDELGVTLEVMATAEGLSLGWPDGSALPLEHVAGEVHAVSVVDPACLAVVRPVVDDGCVRTLRVSGPGALGVAFDRVPAGVRTLARESDPGYVIRHTE